MGPRQHLELRWRPRQRDDFRTIRWGRKGVAFDGHPAAKGLFHRAGVESGATLRSGDPEAAAEIAAALLEELNIPKSQFEKVQTVPTATLVTAQAATLRRINGGRTGGGRGPSSMESHAGPSLRPLLRLPSPNKSRY